MMLKSGNKDAIKVGAEDEEELLAANKIVAIPISVSINFYHSEV